MKAGEKWLEKSEELKTVSLLVNEVRREQHRLS
jgi:hypothetical protein